MNKLLLTAIYSLMLTGLLVIGGTYTAQAKIWRVDNNGGSPGDFTTAQAAYNGAANNDTLYFNGSGTGYGSLDMSTANKRMYIFGPGYFLAANPQTQASSNTAYIDYLYIRSGAAGSLVTGMAFYYAGIEASNILFKRNNVYHTNSNPAVEIGPNSTTPSNVIFVQNFIQNVYYSTGLRVYGGCSNIIVRNNYLRGHRAANEYAVDSNSNLDLAQNVLYGIVNTPNSQVQNNIMEDGSLAGSGNSYYNNASNGTQFPAGNGNLQNQTMSDIFVQTGSDDGYYQLKAGSNAIGAGIGGEDLGMFGGTDPYVLSGLPAIPAIWFFSAPSSGSGASGLNVHIKAKSHN